MKKLKLTGNKTKIVCTIGPASQSREVLERLIREGMNVARLNFAHGDFASHEQTIANIRAAEAASGKRVAIMGDLPGPKMRIGTLAKEPVLLRRGDPFIIQTDEIEGDAGRVSVPFAELPSAVKPGDRIYVSDGFILLEVQKVVGQEIHCLIKVGGELRSYKGVNLPGIDLGISAFTEHDHSFLKFAAAHGLDAISQSFVQGPEDIRAVRDAATAEGYRPFIIAKIERSKAVENLRAILMETDGIMVARGDLGVELPIEEMAVIQKDIIRLANQAAKPVITATHMLESMMEYRRPTRAEATDVANAILDGSDCLMLSGETAAGLNPTQSVAVMSRIATVTEPYCVGTDATTALKAARSQHRTGADRRVSLSIYLSAEAIDPVAVVTPTVSGNAPRLISRFRLPVWIVAFSDDLAICQALQFSYGVFPVYEPDPPKDWGAYAREWLRQHGATEHLALLTFGIGRDRMDRTNHIEIIDLSNGEIS